MFDILFSYSFLENAFLAGLLASILCGIIGSYIVIKKTIFISAGISHISFGGIGIAYYFNFPPFIGALIFAFLSALGLSTFSQKELKQHDAFIGILWSCGMALGMLFIHITPGYAPDLASYLFGNILLVSKADLYIMLILTVFAIFFFTLFYRDILAFAFDWDFAFARGLPVRLFNIVLYVFVAFSIVLLIELVGIILVMALLTIPPSIAMLFSLSFKGIIIVSIVLSMFFIIFGLLLSYYTNIPSGVAITLPQGAVLLLLKFFR